MDCKRAERYILQLIDGELQESRREELGEHLKLCPKCRDLLTDLRLLKAEAKRLKEGVRPFSPSLVELLGRGRPFSISFASPRLLTATVFFLLLLIGGFLSLFFILRGGSSPPLTPSDIAIAHFIEAEYHYEKALELLTGEFKKEKSSLDPELRRVIEKNLAIIDQAINTCQKAIAKHPDNPELRRCLLDIYRKKVTLLEGIIFKKRR